MPQEPMPNNTSSAVSANAVESPDGAAVSAGPELITDWQEETHRRSEGVLARQSWGR